MKNFSRLSITFSFLVIMVPPLFSESYTINVGQQKVISCTASIPSSDNGVIHADFSLVNSSDNTYLAVSQTGTTWCTVYGYYPKDDIQIKVTCNFTMDKMPKTYYYYIYVSIKGVYPKSISMEKSQHTMYVNETIDLSVQVLPTDANTYCWWSIDNDYGDPSNFKIYQANSGLNDKISVSATGAGKCRILVKTLNNLTASCLIEALDIEATGIQLNYSSLTLQKGDTYSMKVTLTPSNATSAVTWKSSNTSVAKVSSGTITAISTGSAVITAKTANGLSVSCTITVIPVVLLYEYLSSSSKATVTSCDDSELVGGVIVIPSTTKYNSKTYNVTTIGKSAFANCKNLKHVIISDGVTTIEDYAFQYCTNLKKMEVPNSISTVGQGVFNYCNNIDEPIYNNRLYMPYDDGVGSGSYVIPEGIKKICYAAFVENRSIKTITLPSTLTDIEDRAFNGSNINKVICLAKEPPYCHEYNYSVTQKEINECFSNTQYNGILVVPDGTESLYKSSSVWRNFNNIKKKSEDASSITLPADGSTLTCSEAAKYASQLENNKSITQTYNVLGYITDTDGVMSYGLQTFWMADLKNGGKIINIVLGSVPEKLQVGDYVKCTGRLMRYDGNTAMMSPSVTLIKKSSSETETISFIPNWVEIRYYPQYELHSLDMFIEENNKVKELLRLVFKADDIHHVSGSYDSNKGSIVTDSGLDRYYVASSSKLYNIGSASFSLSFVKNEGNKKVYRMIGDCILTNDTKIEFNYTDFVHPLTVNIIDNEWKYSDFYLTDKIEEIEVNREQKATKLLQDGIILIRRGNKTYTLQGTLYTPERTDSQ